MYTFVNVYFFPYAENGFRLVIALLLIQLYLSLLFPRFIVFQSTKRNKKRYNCCVNYNILFSVDGFAWGDLFSISRRNRVNRCTNLFQKIFSKIWSSNCEEGLSNFFTFKGLQSHRITRKKKFSFNLKALFSPVNPKRFALGGFRFMSKA